MNTIGPAQFAELLARHDPQNTERFLTLLDTQLEGIALVEKDLSCCVLVRCRIVGSVFDRCALHGSEFMETTFENCRLTSCNLRKADLREADLREVDLTGSEMSRCDLTKADLRGANLTDCVLDWAWLLKTDLREAVLENASFRGTRIGEARLYNSRRFHIGPCDRAVVDDVDLSPAGDGTVIVSGPELWDHLRAPA